MAIFTKYCLDTLIYIFTIYNYKRGNGNFTEKVYNLINANRFHLSTHFKYKIVQYTYFKSIYYSGAYVKWVSDRAL